MTRLWPTSQPPGCTMLPSIPTAEPTRWRTSRWLGPGNFPVLGYSPDLLIETGDICAISTKNGTADVTGTPTTVEPQGRPTALPAGGGAL